MRYPAVELTVTIFFGWLATHTLMGHWHQPEIWAYYGVQSVFGCALLASALLDYDLRVFRDAIDVPGIVLGPLVLCLLPGLLGNRLPHVGMWTTNLVVYLDSPFRYWGAEAFLGALEALIAFYKRSPLDSRHLSGLIGGVLGAAVAGGFLWSARTLITLGLRAIGITREAISMGDVKYLAMIGGFTGWQGALIALFVASLTGSVIGLVRLFRSSDEGLSTASLPLGPFLSVGGFVAAFMPAFPRGLLGR